MKKRCLSLFLAILMAFGSVLPVFATEPVAQTAAAEQTSTKTEAEAFADMYVDRGLVFRWDAYSDVAIGDDDKAVLVDLNGGEKTLSLKGASYDETKKYVITKDAIDFTDLVKKDSVTGAYQSELEFELVLTQLDTNPNLNGLMSASLALGPLSQIGTSKTDRGDSYGGYTGFYIGYAATKPNGTTHYYYVAGDANEGKLAHYNSTTKALDESKTDLLTSSSYAKLTDEDKARVQAFESVGWLDNKGMQVAVEPGWAMVRYFGNTLNQSYSVGASVKFNLAEGASDGSIDLQLWRDGKMPVKNNETTTVTHNGIYYKPGSSSLSAINQANGATYPPATLADAQAWNQYSALEHTSFGDDEGVFEVAGVRFASGVSESGLRLGYHAFRVYEVVLTADERMQNHFADLCNYYQIDNVLVYDALSAAGKKAIYTQAKFNEANVGATPSNTSFEDVTKEELENAIEDAFKREETEKLKEKYQSLYVEGASFSWNAYSNFEDDTVEATLATYGDASLTISGGTSAYKDGYLQALGATLTVKNAYKIPADGKDVSYTTELIYASFDAERDRTYPSGTDAATQGTEYDGTYVHFGINDAPPFSGNSQGNTFTTMASTEGARFIDAEGVRLQNLWAQAYLDAKSGVKSKDGFWTPISAYDYNAMKALIEAGTLSAETYMIREVKVGANASNDTLPSPIGDYSQTGYEANFDAYEYILFTLVWTKYKSSGGSYVVEKEVTGRKTYYYTYDTVTSFPSYITKNDITYLGNWMQQFDCYFGTKAVNWTRRDFGVVTSHTWIEKVYNDGSIADDASGKSATKGNYYLIPTEMQHYSDDVQIVVSSKTDKKLIGANKLPATDFVVKQFDADYYAIRIYPFALSEEERAQNHLADLLNYLKYPVDGYLSLSKDLREVVDAAAVDILLTDADATEKLDAVMEDALYQSLYVRGDDLTEDEMKQNHFADLVNLAKINNLSVFIQLSDASKKILYASFADVQLTEDKETLKTRLQDAIAKAYVGEGNLLAENFVSFHGYQVRLYGQNPGLRSIYVLNDDTIEGFAVLEIGAIMAIADGYKLSDLTPENAEKGEKMASATVYTKDTGWDEDHIFTLEVGGQEKRCFAYTTMYNSEFAASNYASEMLYRGYVTLEAEGEVVTLYTDMTDTLDEISLLSVSQKLAERDQTLVSNILVKRVFDRTLADAADKFNSYEETVNEAETVRLAAIAKIVNARARAYEMKAEIAQIAAEGENASATKKQQLLAEINALLDECDTVSGAANGAFPARSDALDAIMDDLKYYESLAALVDSESTLSVRLTALLDKALAERKAHKSGFTTDDAWKRTDAIDALSVVKNVAARLKDGKFYPVKTFKILAIGNSFSVDATAQLYQVAASLGYEDIVIGNAQIGGCSIERHANSAKNDIPDYGYQKFTKPSTTRTRSESILSFALKDEEWDIITVQQVSQLAPQKATLTDGNLDYLVNYINQNKTNADAEIYYHATWAYATDHDHYTKDKPGYEYVNDQAEMDRLIQDAVDTAILTRGDIAGVIYSGVSIAAAREYFGDATASEKSLYRDGYHLSLGIGRYIISLTWFGTLTGEDITNAPTTTTANLSGADLTAAINAAKVGIAKNQPTE